MSAKRRRIRTRGGVPTRGSVRGGARRVKAHAREQESWNDDPRGERRFTFTGNPGVNTLPEDPEDVVDVFKTFLSDEIIDTFVEYTNLYADTIINTPAIQAQIIEKNKSMFGKWSAVDRDEMWMYTTLTLMMGIVQKPNYDMYWSNDSMYETPIFHRLMSRTRFHAIRSMIHFSDPLQFDLDDSLKKLRYFLDELAIKFRENYTPAENVAVDEYLSLWKG